MTGFIGPTLPPGTYQPPARPDPVRMRPDKDWSLLDSDWETNPLPGDVGQIWDYARCFGRVASRLRDYCTQIPRYCDTSQSGSAITALHNKQTEAMGNLATLATRFERIEEALDNYAPLLGQYQADANDRLNRAFTLYEQYYPELHPAPITGPALSKTPADVSTDLDNYYQRLSQLRNAVQDDISSRDYIAQQCADAIDAAGTDSLKDPDFEFHRGLTWIADAAGWVNMISGTLALCALVIPPPLGEAIAAILGAVSLASGLAALGSDLALADAYHDDRLSNIIWDMFGLAVGGRLIRFLPFREEIPLLKDLPVETGEKIGDAASQGTQIAHSEQSANPWWAPWLPPNPFNAPIPALQESP